MCSLLRGRWWEQGEESNGVRSSHRPPVSPALRGKRQRPWGFGGRAAGWSFLCAPGGHLAGVSPTLPVIPAQTETDLTWGCCRSCRRTGKNAGPAPPRGPSPYAAWVAPAADVPWTCLPWSPAGAGLGHACYFKLNTNSDCKNISSPLVIFQ